ncbi:MAG: UDP-N-acetylglucosamine 2-epimerase (non-hydrolyzing) [Candidatus Hadarchaeum sp.]
MLKHKILVAVGARPNLMKAAPLMEAMSLTAQLQPFLLHTGQHYDVNMSQIFFEELGLPKPDYYLGIGSGSHAKQTAQTMLAFEPVLVEQRPDLLLVVGDVNSTLACTLVASKLHVPVAHVEAGLRSFNRRMPEEINRVVTDALSDMLFTTERQANENLLREGVALGKIYFVGNVMVDTLLKHRERALKLQLPDLLGITPGHYAVLTLHRPENVDDLSILQHLLEAIGEISSQLPVIFPVHPRTRRNIEVFGLSYLLEKFPDLICQDPLGYLEFLALMAQAKFVLTDSGGIQEETTVLGIPCLTLRAETERPVTVTEGTNTLVGTDTERLFIEVQRILDGQGKVGRLPELWDGHAAERIVARLTEVLS